MSRSLNGRGSSTSNIYINNMFEDGESIEIEQTSSTTKAKVSVAMRSNTEATTTLNDSDLVIVSDGTTGKIVKRITVGNLKNAGSHWHLETIGAGTNLYPDNTGYNLLVGTETNTGGADQSKWSQFRCDGKAEITGDLTLGASIVTATGTLTLPTGSRTLATLGKAETFTNKTLTLPKISEASGSETYEIAGGSISANRKITLPDLTGDDILVTADFTQTLSNKTLDSSDTINSSTLTTPKITGGSYKYTLTGASLADNRTLNLPAITTTDTLVCTDFAQTLSNKTLDNSNTLNSCLFDGLRIKGTGLGASYKYTISAGAIGADRTLNLPVITETDTLVTTELTQAISNKTFSSCTYTAPVFTSLVINDTNNTAITITAEDSANPQTLTIPPLDQNVRFVVGEAAVSQTITNTILNEATINDPVLKRPEIYDSDFTHKFRILGGNLTADRDVTIPVVADNTEEFVMTKVSQTLTNKTINSPFLTTPKINDLNATHEYRITAPFDLADHRICNLPQLTQTNDFVFDKHPQTLTNKIITSPSINNILATSDTLTISKADDTTFVQFTQPLTVFKDNEVLITHTGAKGRTNFTTTSGTTLRLQGGSGTSAASGWGSGGGEYQVLTVNTPVATSGSWILFVEGVSTTHSYLGWFFGSTLQMYMTNSGSLYSRTTWTQSDSRIKTNITTEGVNQKCYDIVKRIQAKEYNYKEELINSTEDYTDKKVIGWIADDWYDDSEVNYLSTIEQKPREYYNDNNELLLKVEGCKNIRKGDIGSITWGAVNKLIEIVEEQQEIINKLISSTSFKSFKEKL